VNLFGVFTRGDPQNKRIIVISHHRGNIYEERFMTCGNFDHSCRGDRMWTLLKVFLPNEPGSTTTKASSCYI
jgi:hypothetical protein